MNAFFDFLDARTIVRRGVLAWMIWMTTYAFFWTFEFATTSPRPGGEVAAIIALYNTARKNGHVQAQPPPQP